MFGTYCSRDVKICIAGMNGCNIISLHVALKMYQNWARPKIACGVMCCNVNGIIIFLDWINFFGTGLGPSYIGQLFLREKHERPSKEMAQKNT